VQLTAELFDWSTDGLDAILRILHETRPGFFGVTDLMTEKGHGELLMSR
jgi:hypothetical protein